MTYAALKSYSFYTGANHIESGIPLGTPAPSSPPASSCR